MADKIRDIKTYLVDAVPVGTSGGWRARNWLFVKVETEEGLYGLGEASGWPVVVQAAIRDLTPILIGEDPTRIKRIWQKMLLAMMGHGLTGVVGAGAMTGIDNAVDRKFYEVAKYALKLGISGASKVLLMNKETWNSLAPDLQTTIDKTSQEVIEADLKIAEADEKSLWEVYGKNAEVYAIGQEEEKRWHDAAAGIADKYVQETAAKGYPAKEALELMRKVVSDYKK